MSPELQARVNWLICEQEEVVALLRQELANEETIALALELRLGRKPVDGDPITDEDRATAAALLKLLADA